MPYCKELDLLNEQNCKATFIGTQTVLVIPTAPIIFARMRL
jgi:hypothetical protein